MLSTNLDRAFGALADPTRRAILLMLQDDEAAVHEIAARFEISRPGVSKHLAVLRAADLVNEERYGRENVYSVNAPAFEEVRSWLTVFWRGRLAALKALAESEK